MTPEQENRLLNSDSYRTFLENYIEAKKLKLSDFARAVKCNRGFPGDVLKGRRRLTPKSYFLFENALKLNSSYKNLFQLLVAQEEIDVLPQIDRKSIQTRIQNIKNGRLNFMIQKHATKTVGPTDTFQKVFKNSNSFVVFAASGNPETGATRRLIHQRTRITDPVLDKTLSLLVDHGLLRREMDHYYPTDLHLFFQMKNRDQTLATLFNQGVRAAELRLPLITEDSNEMFFVSQFCIHENQMPHFKKELRNVILKFVDESIASEGDRLVKLLTAFHF